MYSETVTFQLTRPGMHFTRKMELPPSTPTFPQGPSLVRNVRTIGQLLLCLLLLQAPLVSCLQSPEARAARAVPLNEELLEREVAASTPAPQRRTQRRRWLISIANTSPSTIQFAHQLNHRLSVRHSLNSGHRYANGLLAPLRC